MVGPEKKSQILDLDHCFSFSHLLVFFYLKKSGIPPEFNLRLNFLSGVLIPFGLSSWGHSSKVESMNLEARGKMTKYEFCHICVMQEKLVNLSKLHFSDK
jgi:hypothetical protein